MINNYNESNPFTIVSGIVYTAEKPFTIEGQIVTVNRPVALKEPVRVPVVPVAPKPVVPVAPRPVQPITPVFVPVTVRPVQPVVIPARPITPTVAPVRQVISVQHLQPVVVKPAVPVTHTIVSVKPVAQHVSVHPVKPTHDDIKVYVAVPTTTTTRPLFGDANKYSTPGPAYLPSFTDPKPKVQNYYGF